MRNLLKRIQGLFRRRLVLSYILSRLHAIGISIVPYYWTMEQLKNIKLPEFKDRLEDYSFEKLGLQEVKNTAADLVPERIDEFVSKVKKGSLCFGIKHHGRVIAYSWVELENVLIWDKFRLKDNEAYLFDLFTARGYRGKNIAVYLRYEIYKYLNNIGQDTFYSITEVFNHPSVRFKEKLGARFLKLGLSIELFGKYKRNWDLKKYKD